MPLTCTNSASGIFLLHFYLLLRTLGGLPDKHWVVLSASYPFSPSPVYSGCSTVFNESDLQVTFYLPGYFWRELVWFQQLSEQDHQDCQSLQPQFSSSHPVLSIIHTSLQLILGKNWSSAGYRKPRGPLRGAKQEAQWLQGLSVAQNISRQDLGGVTLQVNRCFKALCLCIGSAGAGPSCFLTLLICLNVGHLLRVSNLQPHVMLRWPSPTVHSKVPSQTMYLHFHVLKVILHLMADPLFSFRSSYRSLSRH